MCRLPAFCNAQLWPLFHCLWLMGLLLAEKKNCFSNQCCGINEFDVVKSTSSLVWMFANSFK